MQNTNHAPVKAELNNVVQSCRRFGNALKLDVKKSWKEDIEPKLVKLDLTAEAVTERTFRVAKETLRDVFRHPHTTH